ncbi:MAG: hypothetical protein P1P84_22235 [Deferrisomatales bacterium]|nr:hypothetical protein [Deferrisomatales bacterium]HSH68700.1 hypothetical protein [Deferrisomatales bacterium]
MEYHELEKTTVNRLRELLKEQDPDITGVSGLKKQELVDLLAAKLGVAVPSKVVLGVDKASLKSQIRACKVQRDAAIRDRDRARIKDTRRQLHRLRRSLRRATVVAAE